MDDIKTAVVTGGHPFDVQGFHKLFRRLRGIDAYIQHMEDFASSPREVREQYGAVVFYNMQRVLPGPDREWYEAGVRAALGELGETEQGIVVLHHGLLAYRDWDLWSEIVGIRDRNSTPDAGQKVRLEVAQPKHPITAGLNSWEMVDEIYTMNDADPGSEILITTSHRRSMTTLGWVRQYRKSRVFCFQSGHDDAVYSNVNFREVLARGIRWCARVI